MKHVMCFFIFVTLIFAMKQNWQIQMQNSQFSRAETRPGRDNLMHTFSFLLLKLWSNHRGWALLGRFKKDILGRSNITFAIFSKMGK